MLSKEEQIGIIEKAIEKYEEEIVVLRLCINTLKLKKLDMEIK